MARRSAPKRSPARASSLGWDSPPFEIPADILDAWRAGRQGRRQAAHRLGRPPRQGRSRAEAPSSSAASRGKLPANFDAVIADYKKKLAADKPKVATRKSSEMALEVINGAVPETIGGSADLTGSNNTKTSQTKNITPGDYGQPLCPLRHPRARHGGGAERH